MTNSETYSCNFTVNASEDNGNLILTFSSNSPFRVDDGKIVVYKNGFPDNPAKEEKKTHSDKHGYSGTGSWDTGLDYSTNWKYAWTAKNEKGNSIYLAMG